MKYVVGFLAALLLAIVAGLGVIYTGSYDVAATDPHADPVFWALATTMEQSVERQAEAVVVPATLTAEQAREGFTSFNSMCAQCHGAPGISADEWVEGMRPNPPALSERAGQWSRGELFWIVKNGIKMSAMPAFGPTHEDADIWNIVAFLEELPNISAEEYAALERELGNAGHHGAEGGSGQESGSGGTEGGSSGGSGPGGEPGGEGGQSAQNAAGEGSLSSAPQAATEDAAQPAPAE